jgi:hypothetical protein
MTDDEFIHFMQNRIAELAVSPSAVRNQGSPGIAKAARDALKDFDPREFRTRTKKEFNEKLRKATYTLKNKLPADARHWGTARKLLNLFLRDILYNRYLCEHFKFKRIEKWLELPLDSETAQGIKSAIPPHCLPRWPGIKYLKTHESKCFQKAAFWIARQQGKARIHLDLLYWRNG